MCAPSLLLPLPLGQPAALLLLR
eukprot:COSAG06_NODE_65904_length_255_cov_2.294872_1_plen_22_part_10